MRVLMLVSEAPPIKSGIARVTGELTQRLRTLGIQVDVLSANEIPRATLKEFRFSSLALHWPRIQKQLGEYDILHIHGYVPTFSEAALVMGRLGSRMTHRLSGIVYTHHCDIDLEGLDRIVDRYNAFHHRLLRLADHVVASTPSYALQLDAMARPGRVSAIPFGVNAAQFGGESSKPERFNVLFVGQLRPYKGVDVLLRAWQKVDGADLHIVGTGHESEKLSAMVRQLRLKSVHLHGAVSDSELAEHYANAHALVLPSTRRAEAFGLVLLEGMAAGCVPVASNLPGVRDVVGNTGLTFPVGDSNALAKVLLRLRDDQEYRQRRSELSEARALVFDWDHTARAYLGVYKQVWLGRTLEEAIRRRSLNAEVLQGWLCDLVRETDSDRASIMLRSGSSRDMRIVASVGVDSDIIRTTLVPVGQRISGFVSQTRRPLIIGKRNMPAVARLYKQLPGITSSIVLPLFADGRTVGAINLARGEGRVSFNNTDRRWLHRLAMEVAPMLGAYRHEGFGMAAESLNDPAVFVPYAQSQSAIGPLASDAGDQPAVRVGRAEGIESGYPALTSHARDERVARAGDERRHVMDVITEGWGGNAAQTFGGSWAGE